jgi:ABC-2 type transport system permease protein
MLLAIYTLWLREIIRFFRQRNRVIGALATPIVFWLLLGGGMGTSFRPTGSPAGFSYLEYFFPGTLLMILLFTAIFSTISIIEDRREGFLQGVLVSPISRDAIVLGKILGGTTIATLQGLLFCLLAPWAGLPVPLGNLPSLIAILLAASFGMTALGYLIAWPLDSTQGFHAIMNLFLMPLWMISGALFPPDGASRWLQIIIHVNPLYYALTLLRNLLGTAPSATTPATSTSIIVLLGFNLVLFMACRMLTVKWKGPTT